MYLAIKYSLNVKTLHYVICGNTNEMLNSIPTIPYGTLYFLDVSTVDASLFSEMVSGD